MVRRQIYLPKVLYRRLQLTAKQRNVPVSEVVRDLLDEALRKDAETRRSAGEALLRLAQIGGTGPADLSENLDDYLYGDKD